MGWGGRAKAFACVFVRTRACVRMCNMCTSPSLTHHSVTFVCARVSLVSFAPRLDDSHSHVFVGAYRAFCSWLELVVTHSHAPCFPFFFVWAFAVCLLPPQPPPSKASWPSCCARRSRPRSCNASTAMAATMPRRRSKSIELWSVCACV